MLLDTNAISAWAEQEQGFLDALRGDRPWFLPSIALGEYRFGVVNSTRREALEQWLAGIEASCVVLAPDAETARHYADIRTALRRAHTPIPYHDIWIAALAEQHGLDVVSRDGHFDNIPGIRRIGW
jgi:predicted nucleic acid-binding protein